MPPPPPPARSPALRHGKSGSPSGRQREGGTGFSFHVGPQPTSTQIAGVFGFKGTCLVPSGEGAREGSEGARERGSEGGRKRGRVVVPCARSTESPPLNHFLGTFPAKEPDTPSDYRGLHTGGRGSVQFWTPTPAACGGKGGKTISRVSLWQT